MASNEDCDQNSQTEKSNSHICQTINCGKPASLQCPTCIKLGIKDESHFCTQVKINRIN